MKRHTRLLVLLLLAALLTGCGSKAQQPKEADAAVQTALPPEGITALTLSDDTQVLRFRRDGDIWYWQDDETFPLDQASMPALLEAAAAMTAAPSVPAGDDLSAYGLDDDKTSLSFTADGETLTFTRGDQTASGTPIFCSSGMGSTVTRAGSPLFCSNTSGHSPAHSPHWMHAFSTTIACMENTSLY